MERSYVTKWVATMKTLKVSDYYFIILMIYILFTSFFDELEALTPIGKSKYN